MLEFFSKIKDKGPSKYNKYNRFGQNRLMMVATSAAVTNGSPMENRPMKIIPEDWPKLRELYLPERVEKILGLNTITNYVRWNETISPIDNLTIYSLNGD